MVLNLERHKPSKLTQEEREGRNSPISTNDIELGIKHPPM